MAHIIHDCIPEHEVSNSYVLPVVILTMTLTHSHMGQGHSNHQDPHIFYYIDIYDTTSTYDTRLGAKHHAPSHYLTVLT